MSRLWVFLLMTVLTISSLLKIYGAAKFDFWFDEMISLSFARHERFDSVFWDNIPPTYYLALKFWLSGFSQDALGLRSFNLVVSLLTPLAAFLAAMKDYGKKRAALFAMFLALSSLSIMVGLEVRVYGVIEAVSVWNLFSFDRALRRKTLSKSVLFSWILLFSLHYISLLLIAAELFAFGFFNTAGTKRALKNPKVLLILGVFVSLALLSLLHGVDFSTVTHRAVQDKSHYLSTLYRTVLEICLYSNSFILLMAFLLWREDEDKNLQFVFFSVLLLTFAGTLAFGYDFENPRYLIFLNPLLFWFMAGAWLNGNNLLNKFVVAALFTLNLWSLSYVATMQRAGWKEAGEYIHGHYKSDEVVLMSPEDDRFLFPYFEGFSYDIDEAIGFPEKTLLVILRQAYEESPPFQNLYADHKDKWALEGRKVFGESGSESVAVLIFRSQVIKDEKP